MSTTESIVYEQSVRAISSQQQALDELRSRTAVVLAATGVIAGFLGDAALEDGVGPAGALAILFFAGSAGVSIWVLLPRRESWTWALSARILIEDHLDDAGRNSPQLLHRFLAETIERHYFSNKTLLDRLYEWFWWATLLLAIDIGLWLLELTTD